jgi:hypothetical protein
VKGQHYTTFVNANKTNGPSTWNCQVQTQQKNCLASLVKTDKISRLTFLFLRDSWILQINSIHVTYFPSLQKDSHINSIGWVVPFAHSAFPLIHVRTKEAKDQ